jgi:hypothetical protein
MLRATRPRLMDLSILTVVRALDFTSCCVRVNVTVLCDEPDS